MVAVTGTSLSISSDVNSPREDIARTAITEIQLIKRSGKLAGTLGAVIGGGAGAGIGVAMVAGSGREEYGPIFWGPLVGAVAGGVLFSNAFAGTTTQTIYHSDR